MFDEISRDGVYIELRNLKSYNNRGEKKESVFFTHHFCKIISAWITFDDTDPAEEGYPHSVSISSNVGSIQAQFSNKQDALRAYTDIMVFIKEKTPNAMIDFSEYGDYR